jgi:putative FmdB family regulatory protein
MPTYDYECEKCGHRFEAFQSISEKPLKSCPECSGPVKRLIGAGAGLIFKGSGFYITDYKNKTTKHEPKKRSTPPKKGDGTTSGGAETGSGTGNGKADGGAKSDGGVKSKDPGK